MFTTRFTSKCSSLFFSSKRFLSTSLVEIHRHPSNEQICRIKLNNPKQRNVLSLEMIETLIEAIETNYKQSRVLILTAGDQKVFSSGHNLKELLTLGKTNECDKVFNRCTQLMLKVKQLPIPVIAEVYGLAAAAGCQLVASCDIVVAGDNAQFSTPGVKLGLFCITPAVAVRETIKNPKLSSLMLYTGENIDAKEAYLHGLVSRVVGENDLERETNKIAEQICQHSRSVIGIGKKYLILDDNMEGNDLVETYRLATKGMLENLQLKDTQTGLQCFADKKHPQWSHTDEKVLS